MCVCVCACMHSCVFEKETEYLWCCTSVKAELSLERGTGEDRNPKRWIRMHWECCDGNSFGGEWVGVGGGQSHNVMSINKRQVGQSQFTPGSLLLLTNAVVTLILPSVQLSQLFPQVAGERACASCRLRLPPGLWLLPIPLQDAGVIDVATLEWRGQGGRGRDPEAAADSPGGVCLRQDQDLHPEPQAGQCWCSHQTPSHLALNREGPWGTADDFATSFLHFSLFSSALWDLANSRPV